MATPPGLPGADPLDQMLRDGPGFVEYVPIHDQSFEHYVGELAGQAESPQFAAGYHKGAKEAPKPVADTGKPKRKRVRDARQQSLNKLAQIRYRERKRQKTAGLEEQVQQLTAKVAEQQRAQAAQQALASKNVQLEQQLQLKLRELGDARAMSHSSDDAQTRGGSRPKAGEPDLQQLVKKWLSTIEEIRQLNALLGLDAGQGSFGLRLRGVGDLSSLSPAQQETVRKIWTRMSGLAVTVAGLCVQVLRLQGPDIQSLVAASFDRCSSLQGWKEPAKWLAIVRDLQLSPDQQASMLAARQRSLQGLKRIYEERQMLNRQSLALLVPDLYGTKQASGSEDALFEVLQALEANLMAEQRAVSEQEYFVFKHTLTPIQAGFFITGAFPDHCDCMALLNAAWQVFGQ